MNKISKYLAIVPANCLTSSCDFCDFVTLIDNLVKFALFALILPVCVIAFIFAGVILLSAVGNPQKIERGKKIFFYALWGLILAFAAFLVVNIILTVLVDPSYISFKNGLSFPKCESGGGSTPTGGGGGGGFGGGGGGGFGGGGGGGFGGGGATGGWD